MLDGSPKSQKPSWLLVFGEYRVLRDESVDPRKNGIKWNLDGLDDVGRFAEIAKTLMVIGFWTALDAWTAPILFKERESF